MYERYTMITPILPFIADDKMRSKLICSIAEDHHVSKQTIRNYLCLYLSYLAPKEEAEYGRLAAMVREVNDTQVDVEERLSYHVYVYKRDEEMLKIVA